MSIEAKNHDMGVVFVTLAESLQSDIDTLELNAQDDLDLISTFHFTDCSYSKSDGELACDCIPIDVSTRHIMRLGPVRAAELLEAYLEQPLRPS